MARGAYFLIVRKFDKTYNSEELKALKDVWMAERPDFNGNRDVNSIARYEHIALPNKLDGVVDTVTGETYLEVFRSDYNSAIGPVADTLNVSAYPNSQSAAEIPSATISDMGEAIRYLLSENYSTIFEEVMCNSFVADLADCYTAYIDWRAGEDIKRHSFDYRDERAMLQRIHTVFEAFTELSSDDIINETKHKLIIVRWG